MLARSTSPSFADQPVGAPELSLEKKRKSSSEPSSPKSDTGEAGRAIVKASLGQTQLIYRGLSLFEQPFQEGGGCSTLFPGTEPWLPDSEPWPIRPRRPDFAGVLAENVLDRTYLQFGYSLFRDLKVGLRWSSYTDGQGDTSSAVKVSKLLNTHTSVFVYLSSISKCQRRELFPFLDFNLQTQRLGLAEGSVRGYVHA